MRPDICIIIPSYNDTDFLRKLIGSLYSTVAGASFSVLLVDDCSDDGTTDYILSLKDIASIRINERSYFTRTVNAGLRYAAEKIKPEFYFLLNSDTVVTDGWGAALITTSRQFVAGIVGATLLYPDGRVQHAGAFGAGYHYQINNPWIYRRSDCLVPWVSGSAMLIHSQVYNKIGGLISDDARIKKQYDASDRNFCIKATMDGCLIAVSAGCVIYHYTLQAERYREGII